MVQGDFNTLLCALVHAYHEESMMQIWELDLILDINVVTRGEPHLIAAKLSCDRLIPHHLTLPYPYNKAGFGSSVFEVSYPYGLNIGRNMNV